ncbi:MAG: NAD(P)/FAD-dependent oxidoreductase, partial [Lachnospiraceae bacterium]|nr:NAD(P)/FAD-dependent oxidoreductase [Lachnospiraceae bacterium]
MVDVCIIGAGVTGCSIARELSKYELKTVVLEKGLDVCEGTSKANSGIVHAGFDAEPGTLKAKLNVKGNQRTAELSKELDFSFKQNGSMVICTEEAGLPKLEELLERGRANGVPDMKIISGEEARAMEPNLSKNVIAALLAPTGGIVCPFELTIAFAENANVNGVEFMFDNEVLGITRTSTGYKIKTDKQEIEAGIVINAAGVYADKIHNMVSKVPMEIVARRGEYCLYDKQCGNMVEHTIFQLP